MVSTRYTPLGRLPGTPRGSPAVGESVMVGATDATVVAGMVVGAMVFGDAVDVSVAPDDEQPTGNTATAIRTSLVNICRCFMMCSSFRTKENLSRRVNDSPVRDRFSVSAAMEEM